MNSHRNNFINPKSSIDKDHSYSHAKWHIECGYNSFNGEDEVNSFVLGT